MKHLIISFFLMLTMGCVANQKVSSVYPITGQWEISGIEKDGNYIEPKYEDKVIFVFTEKNFDIFCDNKFFSESDPMFWPSCSYNLESGKLFLKNVSGEKVSADIEFFNPNSFRVSNWKASRHAMAMIIGFRVAITGKPHWEDDYTEAFIRDTKNRYVYFSRVQIKID